MNNKPDIFSGLQSVWSIFIRLFRFFEDGFYVNMASLFGIISADGQFGWQLILVMLSNWLASGLANVFQTIDSAPSDVIQARNENPIAKGEISLKVVSQVAALAWLVSLAGFFLIGWKVGLIGLVLTILGWGCRHQSFSLRRIPFSFLICHGLIKAALPFLTAFFTFQPHLNKLWLYPFLSMLAFKVYIDSSGLLKEIKSGKIFSERTFTYLGERGSQLFALIFLGIGIVSGLITIVFLDIIPLWVIILIIALVLIFLIPQFIRMQQTKNLLHIQTPLHIPLEKSVAIALLMQLLIPWLIKSF